MIRFFSALRGGFRYFWFFALSLLYSELLVRLCTIGDFGTPSFYLFTLTNAACFAFLCSLFGKRGGKIALWILHLFCLFLFALQLVYHHIFDSFVSLSQFGMGADAATSFLGETMRGIGECVPMLLLLLLPTALLIFLSRRRVFGRPASLFASLCVLLTASLFFGLSILAVNLDRSPIYAARDIYYDTFILSKAERHFGVLTSARLELEKMLFGQNSKTLPAAPAPAVTARDDEPLSPLDPPKVQYEKNITNVDFDALIANEEDEDIRALHRYFAAQPGTFQNEYTGMFAGYNLIVLCCESYSPYIIDKERTPTLYKMATEGFIFSDFYNTVCDNTSNGEYALCVGLLPDTTLLGKGWTTFYSFNSFTAAKNNLLPFCFGNQFRALGAATYAVHNYKYDYYGRHKTHPNMGYTYKAMYQGLKKDDDWPTSDVSMMEQTLPDLLAPDENGKVQPFHAYYLTFSGHMSYVFSANAMAEKNRAVSEGLPYSTAVRAYISCQEELEYALTYMNEQLEAAGVADNTLIVLCADHYPYNLTLDKLSELAGRPMDPEFDKFKSGLLIWSASMKEPVKVDVPCCTLDILPTVSNLLGLTFDSRLLMGTDVFSDSEHIAILADRSFVTDKVAYDCENDRMTLREGVTAVEDGYLDRCAALIRDKFTLSSQILYTDYYAKVYGGSAE